MKRVLSEEQRQRLFADFADVFDSAEIDGMIEEALNHTASRKWIDVYYGCRGWIRRAATPIREYRKRQHSNGKSAAETRDISKYFEWNTRQKK